MSKTFNSWFGDSEEAKKLYAQESLLVNTSEDFLILMENMDVTKSKLSKLIGRTKSYVTQSLNGTRNMTLRTLADMAYALDATVKVSFEPNTEQSDNLFNDDDHFIDKANNKGLIVAPVDVNQGRNAMKVNFASNDHYYENQEPKWYKS
ncbi:MAG: helix-turn-helix transcriptional regulator [gamma proteobacterium symbiont of Taylorina sp.]|nr:helix-turn-helix transcriptional regulator [gamma proteobacterium symbiont of Taylorina sp.]